MKSSCKCGQSKWQIKALQKKGVPHKCNKAHKKPTVFLAVSDKTLLDLSAPLHPIYNWSKYYGTGSIVEAPRPTCRNCLDRGAYFKEEKIGNYFESILMVCRCKSGLVTNEVWWI